MTAAGGVSYSYDNDGNQTGRGSDVFTYDHENRLTKVTLPNTPTPQEPCYDLNGDGYVDIFDQAEIIGQAGGSDLFYDLNSSGAVDATDAGLVTGQFSDSCVSRFTYNGDGIRTARAGGWLNSNYVWDVTAALPEVLKETDSHNAASGLGTDNTYVYGLDLISVTDRSGIQSYFVYGGLGSTGNMTDGSGNTTATYSYDVFGAMRSETGSGAAGNEWRFTGEQRDRQGNRNFYYLRARYYDLANGRFLSLIRSQVVNLTLSRRTLTHTSRTARSTSKIRPGCVPTRVKADSPQIAGLNSGVAGTSTMGKSLRPSRLTSRAFPLASHLLPCTWRSLGRAILGLLPPQLESMWQPKL